MPLDVIITQFLQEQCTLIFVLHVICTDMLMQILCSLNINTLSSKYNNGCIVTLSLSYRTVTEEEKMHKARGTMIANHLSEND